MKLKHLIMSFILVASTSTFAAGGDIGLGTIKGIKVYNNTSLKYTKIYLNDNASHKTLQLCNGEGKITHKNYETEPESLNQMISIALAAYMGGKKVRIYAADDLTCEITFIAIQETYF